ncbi:MAG: cation:dicarboxylase symporter family transporter [Eubacterium sp.]|nr:cation:dicarboxylase symporter family transporter [Eubacterium sp.]
MATNWVEYDLTNETIEEISGKVQTYLKDLKEESRNVQRNRLIIEELLLRIRDAHESPIRIRVMLGRRYGRYIFRIAYPGAAYDPTDTDEEENVILETMGVSPMWEYRKGTNTVSLVVSGRAKRGRVFKILIAIFLAGLLGYLGRFIPKGVITTLDDSIVTPMMDCYLGLLSTFAGIMIGLTITSGVLGVGDSSVLSKLGKVVMIRFAVKLVITSILAMAVTFPLFDLVMGNSGSGGSFQIENISQMIFDIVPENLIDPFLKGNSLQIIVIGIFVGVGLMALGERAGKVRSLVLEGTSLAQWLTSTVCSLVPGFVFLALLHQIWGDRTGALLSVWRPLLIIIGVSVVLSALSLLISSAHLKCSPIKVLKKVLPPFLIGLTTGSSMSAFTLGMETCQKKFGVDESYVRFAYPLGNVMYMEGTVAYLTVISMYFAESYHIEINLLWMVTVVLTSTLLAIAVPPIPGAALMLFTILFAQLGIPVEALAVAAAMDIVMDFLDTGDNLFHLILEVATGAKSLKLVDKEVLRR